MILTGKVGRGLGSLIISSKKEFVFKIQQANSILHKLDMCGVTVPL